MKNFEIEVLGSGTSTGVPIPSCNCSVCKSKSPKNKRLRTSIAVSWDKQRIIVDTGPDFRTQVLRSNIEKISAVLFTHGHADHILGLDDLRGFNFSAKNSIPLYADRNCVAALKQIFSYIFAPDPNYLGGALAKLEVNEIKAFESFNIQGLEITPIPLIHGKDEVLGFRIGNFAYLTDCNEIPEKSLEELSDLEYLIIDGLRERPHKTHLNFEQAIDYIEKLKPKKSYLTHVTHEIEHQLGNQKLKEMTDLDVELAYDGLKFEIL